MAYGGAPVEGAAEEQAEAKRPRKRTLDDQDFKAIVRAERRQAIGMEPGDVILEERLLSYEYYKGQMDDVPSLPMRSKVTSTDVSDGILTAMPDLVEIYMGGEDIGTFRARNAQDVEQAEQETEAVNHVIMHENDGFSLVHDGIHDALLAKTGIYHFWVEENEKEESEDFEQQPVAMLMLAKAKGNEILNLKQSGIDPMSGQPLYSFTAYKKYTQKCVKIDTVTPDDFSAARDTKAIRDTTYCCMRTRPRAQDLKAKGYDPDLIDELPQYSAASQIQADQARDLAGEHRFVTSATDSTFDLRTVLVYKHVVRVDAYGTGEPQIWQVVTGENEDHVLEVTELSCIPFAVGSPFKAPHRLYGRSLADLLIEIQRIKTSLMRMSLDSGYFALNVRHEVAEQGASDHTISDLLNNQPGMPVRVKQSGTITPISPGQMAFDPFEALEYFATVAEQRTGIVRNAQGLNPDTLHDTAKGAMALMQAAQRRLRMIARTLAETLFKDLFLGVHQLLREHGSPFPVGAEFQTVDPTTWATRDAFDVSIGLGGGREYDLMLLEAVKGDMAVTLEGQASGAIPKPVVTPDNVYAILKKRAERAGLKGAEEFYTDPKTMPDPQPQQDPEMVKLQMQQQHEQQQLQMQQQMEQAKMAMEDHHTQLQAQKDLELAQQQQADDRARVAVEAQDKQQQHERELVKLANENEAHARDHAVKVGGLEVDRFKAETDAAAKQRELELKEQELALKERELNQQREQQDKQIAHERDMKAADIQLNRQKMAVDSANKAADRNSKSKFDG